MSLIDARQTVLEASVGKVTFLSALGAFKAQPRLPWFYTPRRSQLVRLHLVFFPSFQACVSPCLLVVRHFHFPPLVSRRRPDFFIRGSFFGPFGNRVHFREWLARQACDFIHVFCLTSVIDEPFFFVFSWQAYSVYYPFRTPFDIFFLFVAVGSSMVMKSHASPWARPHFFRRGVSA